MANYETNEAKILFDLVSSSDTQWIAKWTQEGYAQQNFKSAKYNGRNQTSLFKRAIDENIKDPRWLTFNQINEMGYKLKKGSKASQIHFYTNSNTIVNRDEKGKPILDENGNKQFVGTGKGALVKYNVFSAQDVEGIPKFITPKIDESFKEEKYQKIQEMVDAYCEDKGITIKNIASERALNRKPMKDNVVVGNEIVMPEFGQFGNASEYYSVLFHELSHSTSEFVERTNPVTKASFGSKEYAKEELVAELGSLELARKFALDDYSGEDTNEQNSLAYLRSWVKAGTLNEEDFEVALKDSKKATNLIISYADEEILSKIKNQAHEINEAAILEQEHKVPMPQEWAFNVLEMEDKSIKNLKDLGEAGLWNETAPLEDYYKAVLKKENLLILDVKYEDRGTAKQMGAKWNNGLKSWVTDNTREERAKFKDFIPEKKSLSPQILASGIEEFKNKCTEIGIDVKSLNVEDYSRNQRLPLVNKGQRNQSGSVRLFKNSDGTIGGNALNFKTKENVKWIMSDNPKNAKNSHENYHFAVQQYQGKVREQALSLYQDTKAEEARKIYTSLPQGAPETEYTKRKGIDKHDGKVLEDGTLVLPIVNKNGQIRSLQAIAESGDKYLMKGAEKAGNFILARQGLENEIVLTEGYATAKTIEKMDKSSTIIAAIDSYNYQPVVNTLTKDYKRLEPLNITICADNDAENEKKGLGNSGVIAAEKIIQDVRIITPPAINGKNTDWNDCYLKNPAKTAKIFEIENAKKPLKEKIEQDTQKKVKAKGHALKM